MALPEIVDHILGFLHSDGHYADLETCSHIFPQLVERHLYSQITFVTDSSVVTDRPTDIDYIVDSTRFSQTLIDHPHVASYVRSVSIILGTTYPFWPELAVISSNLSNLPQIKSFALSSTGTHSWKALNQEFRTAIQRSIRLPSIKEITISYIKFFPLDILEDCKNLERLRLFCQYVGGEAVSTSSYPRLSYLGVRRYGLARMTRVASWMRNNALHTLLLRLDIPDLSPFRTLFEACSATLVNLELNHLWIVERHEHPALPLLQLPVLEQIIIRARVVLDSRNHPKSSHLLLAPFTLHPISAVRLCLHLELQVYPENALYFDWSDLAAFLVLPVCRHPIELSILQMGSISLADIISSCKQHSDLERLHETGELVIKSRSSIHF